MTVTLSIPTAQDELEKLAPRMHDYLGVWAMQDAPFQALFDQVARVNLLAHVQAQAGKPTMSMDTVGQYELNDQGIAQIPIVGTLMKAKSSFGDSASTVSIRSSVRAAANDPKVKAILLQIDSPGGTVAGTVDLADEIAVAGQKKPVWAYIEDCCCSGAMWLASQAQKVYSNRNAVIGSIGVLNVIRDTSVAADKAGIKIHVIKSAELKGMGTPGAPITEEQLAEAKSTIDALHELFARAVQQGRHMTAEQVAQVATGAVWIGAAAKQMGLIDGVQSLGMTLSQLMATVSTSPSKGSPRMSTANPNQPVAASYAEIIAACEGIKATDPADAVWIGQQQAAGATVEQVGKNWAKELTARVTAANLRAEELATKLKDTAPKVPGVQKITSGAGAKNEDLGDAKAQFDDAVKKLTDAGLEQTKAIAQVVKQHPDLHKAMLAEVNAK